MKPFDYNPQSTSRVACLAQALAKQARCWQGYEPVPGKAPYSEDSCRPVGSKKKKEKRADSLSDYAVPLGVVGLGATLGGAIGRYTAPTKDEKGKPVSRLGPTLRGAALGGITGARLSRGLIIGISKKLKNEHNRLANEQSIKSTEDFQRTQQEKTLKTLNAIREKYKNSEKTPIARPTVKNYDRFWDFAAPPASSDIDLNK